MTVDLKCTDCNQPLKPVVGLDLDGTLGDWHTHWFQFAAGWLGVDALRLSQWLTYDGSVRLAEWMDLTDEMYRQIKLAFRQSGLKRTMPIYTGARELVHDLRAVGGCEVWITTTRPYLRLDNVDPDTREWLRRHGIQYKGLIYDEDKYEVLTSLVGKERIVGILDDLPKQIHEAERLDLPVVQRVTQYNRAVRRGVGCGTLAGARQHLLDAANRWNREHNGIKSNSI